MSIRLHRLTIQVCIACMAGVLAFPAVGQEHAGPALEVAARAEELARAGKTVEAETLAAEYASQHPRSVPVNVVLGELAAYRRAWPQAMKYYETALLADPNDPAAQRGEEKASLAFALSERNTGNAEVALATLEHARTVLPQDLPVLLALAVQAQAMHRLKTAMDAADAAMMAAPGNDKAVYTAAGIHYERGESTVAARLYREYLLQQPNDASAHFGLGRALRVQQANEEAKRELNQSIQLQPVQTEAYFQLGEIAMQEGKQEEARADYERVLARMPTHAGALTGMGQVLYRLHDYAQARAYLDRAVAAEPEYQPSHYYLGLTLRRLSDTSGAERELQVAVQLAAKQQGKGAPVAAQ